MSLELERLLEMCCKSRLSSWASHDDHVQEAPFQLYINPTNICNNRCAMCAHHKVMRAERGHMSMELFKRIAAQIPDGVQRVYLLKQGEPFLNPQTPAMLEHLKASRPDLYVSVHTNFTLPLDTVLPTVLKAVDSLGLSISAMTRKTYEAVHGRDHFDKVLRNVHLLCSLLESMKPGDRPHVFVDYVRQPANQHENTDDVFNFFVKMCPLLASVDFHSMFNWQGDIGDQEFNPERIASSDAFPCCIFPWSTMTICHDGKVSYCQEEAKENIFLGDLQRESLLDVWNGDPVREQRRLMLESRYDDLLERGYYCKYCSYLWDTHAQSPQNLSAGYFRRKDARKEPRYGNLLAMSADGMLLEAMRFYLAGEIHKTLGCVEHLKGTDCPDELLPMHENLESLCRKVLDRYASIYSIQRSLKKLGWSKNPNNYRVVDHLC